MTDEPWTSSDATNAVQLVALPGTAIRALAAGDLKAANRASPVALTPYLAGPHSIGIWRMRSAQIDDEPAARAWITRVIVDSASQLTVGRAGFHGPPDGVGMVEVGYAVDPIHRRKGYARAALEVLLDVAARDGSVPTVRASISPDNTASRRLVAQYGFVEVGQQWDVEDGLEIVFEVTATAGVQNRKGRREV